MRMLGVVFSAVVLLVPAISMAQGHDDGTSFGPPNDLGAPEFGDSGDMPPRPHHEGQGPHEGGGVREQFGAKMAERLGLSPEQRQQLKTLHGDRDEQEKTMLKVRLARIELKEMIQNDGAKDDEIMKRAEDLTKMMVDQNMQRIKRLLAVRKILTPEQRATFKELMAERKEHRMGAGPQGKEGGMRGEQRGERPFGKRFKEFQERRQQGGF